MPTIRGWSLLGGSIGLLIGGRILGLSELAVPALAGLVAVALAVVWTRRRRLDVTVERRVSPRHGSVGGRALVVLVIRNSASRSTPVLAATDRVDDGRRVAPFLIAPIAGGEEVEGAYNLPTPTRGRVTVGPLRLTLTDPFGIARRHIDDSLVDELLVHPRVHALGTLPDAVAQWGAEVSQVWRTDADGAFRSVREYRHGDDPRRIHWKSTARTGSVMVREHEQRSSAPVTVFFDTRRAVHDVASFERGVEVAASVVCALEDRRRPFRLVTSEGVLLDAAQLGVRTTLGEELALLEPTPDPESPIPHDAVSAAAPKRPEVTSPGALTVMILGSGSAGATPGTTPRHTWGGPVVAVLTRGSGATAIPAEAVPIDATDMSRFPEAWNEASRKWSSVEGGSRWTQRVAARR